MRNLAAILVAIFCLLNVACEQDGVILQTSQQGEWSNFQNSSHKISEDARPAPEKHAAEK